MTQNLLPHYGVGLFWVTNRLRWDSSGYDDRDTNENTGRIAR